MSGAPSTFPFLRLPLELQEEILSYVLPFPSSGDLIDRTGEHWIQGAAPKGTAIFRVCRHISELALHNIFRDAVFHFDVYLRDLYSFEGILQWNFEESEPRFVHPVFCRRNFTFPDSSLIYRRCIGNNVRRIRNCVIQAGVQAELHNEVLGNWGKVQKRIQELVGVINRAEHLDTIEVRVMSHYPTIKGNTTTQARHQRTRSRAETEGLEPLRQIKGAKTVTVTGNISQELKESLKDDMERED
ncbi:MAG: hypothetical protein M1820_000123 [Bogoriella megaspora]|nr:MAG: hypothetical protein M1820_000123 [Bogoriella megaspora]